MKFNFFALDLERIVINLTLVRENKLEQAVNIFVFLLLFFFNC